MITKQHYTLETTSNIYSEQQRQSSDNKNSNSMKMNNFISTGLLNKTLKRMVILYFLTQLWMVYLHNKLLTRILYQIHNLYQCWKSPKYTL